MKTLFVSLNSSYIHTLLAPRYLVANSPVPVTIFESNVNKDMDEVLQGITKENPDTIAFSCYIFNIAFIKKLLPKIRKSLPKSIIILGGYEATFAVEELMPLCDFILKGEGDIQFGQLLQKIENKEVCPPKVFDFGTVKDLDSIKSPYVDEYLKKSTQHKIIYMETCRGCPFCCSYCMSANTLGVRSFSLERVFSDFEKIMSYNPPLVKLVDRTFNFNMRRAEKIFSFLIDNYGDRKTRFHFEMEPELFDEKLFEVLLHAPKGLFQFEIGVQSYNQDTLKAVKRKVNIEKVEANISRLISMKTIPIHVDLIAGLPYENMDSFIYGFNRLFSLKPDCLQSGFLKILKGSEIEKNKDNFEIESCPPYEVISTPCISKDELETLKKTVFMLDTFYNSHRFDKSINFLCDKISPFSVFQSLSILYDKNKLTHEKFSSYKQSDLLFEFGKNILEKNDIDSLEFLIYQDFIDSGNTRKWHRFLENKKK